MPTRRKTSTLILAVALLILLVFSLSGDEGAVETKTTLEQLVPGVDAARKALKEMNTQLDKVIAWYKSDVIEGVATSIDAIQLKRYVALLHEKKMLTIMIMPDYLGIPFYRWYYTFQAIDEYLNRAASHADDIRYRKDDVKYLLERVQTLKKDMESWLPQQGE